METKHLAILAEPKRLQILELLRTRPLPVNEIAKHLQVSQPQASKHLHTLSKAGLIQVYPVAQQRFYGINPTGMKKVYEWAASFRPLWDTKVGITETYLKAVQDKQARIIPSEAQPFTIERTITAPRTMIWEALTIPVLLAQWFAPDYFTVPVCDLDVRPGGKLRIDMQAADGAIFSMVGTYKEVAANERLRLVTSPLGEKGDKLFETSIVISLADEGEHTKVSVKIHALSAGPKAAPHLAGLQPGWEQNLTKLNRMFENTLKRVRRAHVT